MNQNTSKIHLEILGDKRQELLKKLSREFPAFALGGGTALALQIKHRQSFDLDFFIEQKISRKLLDKLKGTIQIEKVIRDTDDELTVYSDSIKVTFLSYPFHNLFEHIEVEDGIKYFSIQSIAAQKAYAIGRRGVWRDYFDLYSILKEHSSIKDIIENAVKFYGAVFNPKIFLEQLVYFDDIDDLTINPIEDRPITDPAKVKSFLKDKVKEYLEQSSLI